MIPEIRTSLCIRHCFLQSFKNIPEQKKKKFILSNDVTDAEHRPMRMCPHQLIKMCRLRLSGGGGEMIDFLFLNGALTLA